MEHIITWQPYNVPCR